MDADAVAEALKARDAEIMRLHREHDNYVLAEGERVADARREERERIMRVFDDYYAPDDWWANKMRAELNRPPASAPEGEK